MEKMISISKASKILGVDIRTLQRWDNDGKLIAYRTLGGLVSVPSYMEAVGVEKPNKI